MGCLLFCPLVPLQHCVSSFGAKQLDKAAWRCFAGAEPFHGDTEIVVTKSRSSPPLVESPSARCSAPAVPLDPGYGRAWCGRDALANVQLNLLLIQ